MQGAPGPVVDPVVQALTLTDIVVSATVTALLLALVIQVAKRTGTVDPDKLTSCGAETWIRSWLPPLGIAIPLAGACVVLAVAKFVPRLVIDVLAMLTAVAGIAGHGAAGGRDQRRPGDHLGRRLDATARQLASASCWSADPTGAGLALLTAALTACALIYSWRYFDERGRARARADPAVHRGHDRLRPSPATCSTCSCSSS